MTDLNSFRCAFAAAALALALATDRPLPGEESGIKVDKEKKTVSVPCSIAPRKLADLSEVYPLEVIGTRDKLDDGKRAQKAHETVVLIAAKPSDVHKALEELGLKSGKPAKGENATAEGPEVEVFLELAREGGTDRQPIEKLIVDRKTGKPMPKLKWRFTGSVISQPDPDKPDKVYGADHTGTLIAIFPVTDETVLQTNLTMKEEKLIKLETNKKLLPAEGVKATLVIVAK
jgi:hypothetical protein